MDAFKPPDDSSELISVDVPQIRYHRLQVHSEQRGHADDTWHEVYLKTHGSTPSLKRNAVT